MHEAHTNIIYGATQCTSKQVEQAYIERKLAQENNYITK